MSHAYSDDEGDEMLECPLCTDPLDLTERCFKPCPCGYQMCSFCFHRIVESEGNKCPACRRAYNPNNYVHMPIKSQDMKGASAKGKAKTRGNAKADAENRKSLTNIRVVQRNLVYVTNLSLDLAKEEILRKTEYFGQYGKIAKMVVNRSNVYQGSSVSCYVTYSKPEEAYRCIETVDGCVLNDKVLRASFGTTKYCSYFLRNRPCTNPDCMYLHELGDDKDSFTKEDMQAGKHLSRVPPPQASHQTSRTSGLPAPRNSLRASMAMPLSKPATSIASSSVTSHTKPVADSSSIASHFPTATTAAAQGLTHPSAWKTQSVGPSQAHIEHRKNEMGESTQSQKTARNTAMLMQQFDEEFSDDEESGYDDDSESSDLTKSGHTKTAPNLADEAAFPSLRSSSTSTPSTTAPTTATTHSLTSSQPHAPHSRSNSKHTHPVPSQSSTQSSGHIKPQTTTTAAAPTSHNHRTHHSHHSEDSTSRAPSHSSNHSSGHGKSHWHAKEKPIWQPKANQNSSGSSASSASSSLSITPTSTDSLSSSVTTPLGSVSIATTPGAASTPIPNLQSSGATSPPSTLNHEQADYSTLDLSGQDGANAAAQARTTQKSPWKTTPTPTPISISETIKAEADRAAALKLSVGATTQSLQTNSKSSALPSTVSWASSATAPSSAAPVNSKSAYPESEALPKQEKAVEKEKAKVDMPQAQAPTTQPHHQPNQRSGKGKAKATYAKVQTMAPPKEPVFDAPAPTVTATQPSKESTISPSSGSAASMSSASTSESTNHNLTQNSIQSGSPLQIESSMDDDLPRIPFAQSQSSSSSSLEAAEEDEGEPTMVPSYLLSSFAGFGTTQAPNAAHVQQKQLNSAAAIGTNQAPQGFGERFTTSGAAVSPQVLSSSGINPIGSPKAVGSRQRNVEPHSNMSQLSAPSSASSEPFSLLSSEPWGFGGNSGVGNAGSNSSQSGWPSFGSGNLFAPYASTGGSMDMEDDIPSMMSSSGGNDSGNRMQSRFAFASPVDPQMGMGLSPTSAMSSSGGMGGSAAAPGGGYGLSSQHSIGSGRAGLGSGVIGPHSSGNHATGNGGGNTASGGLQGPQGNRMSNAPGGPSGPTGHYDFPPGLFPNQLGNNSMSANMGNGPNAGQSMNSQPLGPPGLNAQQQQQMQHMLNFQQQQQQHQQAKSMQQAHMHGYGRYGETPSSGWFTTPSTSLAAPPEWSLHHPTQSHPAAAGPSQQTPTGVQQGQSILSQLSGGANPSSAPTPHISSMSSIPRTFQSHPQWPMPQSQYGHMHPPLFDFSYPPAPNSTPQSGSNQ